MLRFLLATAAACLGTVHSSSVWTAPVELNINAAVPHKHHDEDHPTRHSDHNAKDLSSEMKSWKESNSDGELPTCPTSR